MTHIREPKSLKNLFPFFENNSDLSYFDHAATSQRPQIVIDAMSEYYSKWNSNAHRSTHQFGRKSTEWIESARQKVSEWLNLKNDYLAFWTQNTTDSLNQAASIFAQNCKLGDVVLVGSWEHHAQLLPWQYWAQKNGFELRAIPLNADMEPDLEWVKSELSHSKNKIRGMVWSDISNVLGFESPTEELCKIAQDKGLFSVVDCAQSVVYGQIDLQKINASAIAFSAHKMYGPFGVGVLVLARDIAESAPFYKWGGGMVQSVSWTDFVPSELPWSREPGTPDIAGIYAFSAALDFVKENQKNILDHNLWIAQKMSEELEKRPWLKRLSHIKSSSLLTIVAPQIHSYDLGMYVDELNVAVRVGQHCASPLCDLLQESSVLRVSWGLYNDEADVLHLWNALDEASEAFL
jgi:selenocysteine lyase/cysteine desulfurase